MNSEFYNDCQDMANDCGWRMVQKNDGVHLFKNGSLWGVFEDEDEAYDARMENDSEMRMGC
jgi:hypothetical protein